MKKNTIIGWGVLLVGIIALGISFSLVPESAHAEDASVTDVDVNARYAGTYKYGKSLDHGRAIVRKAMEKAIDQLSFLYRGMARRKLAASDPLIRSLIIELPEGKIGVTLIGQKRASFSTRPGVTEKVTNPQGKQVDLTQRFTKQGLEQVFVGPKGGSRALYTLGPDDRQLVVNMKMSGGELDSPISYQLVYIKQ